MKLSTQQHPYELLRRGEPVARFSNFRTAAASAVLKPAVNGEEKGLYDVRYGDRLYGRQAIEREVNG